MQTIHNDDDVSTFIQAARKSQIGLFAQFGGQGANYLDELRDLFHSHKELLTPIIKRAEMIMKEQSNSAEARLFINRNFFSEGLDLLSWLEPASTTEESTAEWLPSEEYLASSPISYPLILLTQLCRYYTTAKSLFPNHSNPILCLRNVLKGTTGHSQGVVAAVVISVAEDEEQFVTLTLQMFNYLFWQGSRMLQSFIMAQLQQYQKHHMYNEQLTVDQIHVSEELGYGKPTPMVAILGLQQAVVQKHIQSVNSIIDNPEIQIEMSLINGPRAFVCSGSAQHLHILAQSLQKIQLKNNEDQSRIPFSKRKHRFTIRYLSVSTPFHSSTLMKEAVYTTLEDTKRLGIQVTSKDLKLPVYSTVDGSDMRLIDGTDNNTPANGIAAPSKFMETLIKMQCTEMVHWEKALKAASNPVVTHILDFGPGKLSGSAGLTARVKEGRGVWVVVCGVEETDARTLPNSVLFENNPSALILGPSINWEHDFAPKLVRLSDNRIMLDTKFSRLIGKPPIMVAGMTPTTANEQIVAAFTNGGFHGEFAGGGQATDEIYRTRIRALHQLLKPAEGIHVNILYLNPKLWAFQFNSSIQMKQVEHIPIESVTVAAGVPTPDRASEIIEAMQQANMKFISFKPGSTDAIKQVVAIAAAHPDMTVVIQWTGGRGGGHHSFEDVHEPILETYAAIRRQPNTVLLIGSGLGDAPGSFPYITGQWSTVYGYPPMPYDGILLGSRIMVAKEALTSDEVKELIVKTQGVQDEHWEKSYDADAGGVVTVVSELGEPIHKVATRGIMLWKEFDQKFFSHPAVQQEKFILENKDYIIKRLNADYQKVYFGKKMDGSVVDLHQMTYAEVAKRMIDLMYSADYQQWIHFTYLERFQAFMKRIQERFYSQVKDQITVTSTSAATEPETWLNSFLGHYSHAYQQLLCEEDVDYFVSLCKERGKKPVNFVPVIDRELSFWFKKDSLWQSENLQFVEGKDAGRVCILQGPVSVQHSTKPNEPVADILGNIHTELVALLKQSKYDHASVPFIEYIGGSPVQVVTEADLPKSVRVVTSMASDKQTATIKIYFADLETELPTIPQWLQYLSTGHHNWIRAFLTSPYLIHHNKQVENYIPQIFKPRVNQSVEVVRNLGQNQTVSVKIFESHSADLPVVELHYIAANSEISLTLYHLLPTNGQRVALTLKYAYKPEIGYAPIETKSSDNVHSRFNNLVKQFYGKLWFGADFAEDFTKWSVTDTFTAKKAITRESIELFCNAIGIQPMFSFQKGKERMIAPVDYCIVAAWESIVKTLFPVEIDANLFKLLHLSYGYRILVENGTMREGDVVTSKVEIMELLNLANGKRVTARGLIIVDGTAIIEVNSQFFFPGSAASLSASFARKSIQRLVDIDKKQKHILLSKQWLQFDGASTGSSSARINEEILRVGSTLHFNIESIAYPKPDNDKTFSFIKTTGVISLVYGGGFQERIGQVHFEAKNLTQDPVESYVLRFGRPLATVKVFESGGNQISVGGLFQDILAREENQTYSVASGDFNPIHSNPCIADMAGLPSTITHGMWSAAVTRNLIEKLVLKKLDSENCRVLKYEATFLDKVNPRDRLHSKITHVGMKNGLKLIEVSLYNKDNVAVLKAVAEVSQPPISFVFTGQGSAEIGMGMELYRTSKVAKEIWDKAEAHLLENFGFSILDIVNKNPKSFTIFFRGKRGSQIRRKYMRLHHEITVVNEDKSISTKSIPLFPGITDDTDCYTFQHPQGLLFATQFTQPALVLLEKACFSDMQAKGLVPKNAKFAGHSLGEYAALASVASVLSVESLVELVFLRGMTMQNAVLRDELGRSTFGMIAVNPQRVNPFFSAKYLHQLVDAIEKQSGKLLQIVNYNVDNWQYIVTGANSNLEALRVILNEIKANPEKAKSNMKQVIDSALAQFADDSEYYPVQQGSATIPLPGIDVPFHSKFLLSEVPSFREYLMKALDPKTIDTSLLEGQYVPNLIAKPFEVSIDYAKAIMACVDSSILPEKLESRKWDLSKLEDKQLLAYYLLVELLAFQFASPVRWIETQDFFFKSGVQRFIEIGPESTLKGMAKRTLATGKYQSAIPQEILSFKEDRELIYYENNDAVSSAPVQAPSRTPKPAAPKPAATAPTPAPTPAPVPIAAAPVPAAAPSGAAITVTLDPLDVLRVLLALKLKKPADQISPESSIRDQVGGKSAVQNEILGELQKEFGAEPEGAAEMPIAQLAKAMGGSYQKPGPQSLKQISRLVSTKMAGGFGMNEIREHLTKQFNMTDSTVDGVMIHALTMEPASRIENVVACTEWLTAVATSYGAKKGFSVSVASSGQGGSGTTRVIDSAELTAFQKKQEKMIMTSIKTMADYVGYSLREGLNAAEAEVVLRRTLETELAAWESELGKPFGDGIKSMFDPHKVRHFNSYWNWARQEAFQLLYYALDDNPPLFGPQYCHRVTSLINRGTPELVDLVTWIAELAQKENNLRVARHVQALANNISANLERPPVFRIMISNHNAPNVEITKEGKVVFKEVARKNVTKFEDFVQEMKKGISLHHIDEENNQSVSSASLYTARMMKRKNKKSKVNFHSASEKHRRVPYLFLKLDKTSDDPTHYDPVLTNVYYRCLSKFAQDGATFQNKCALVTGCGKGSIGLEIVKGLLAGGATVVVTTSRFSKETCDMYRDVYMEWGGKDSELILFPFNQASTKDVKDLVTYIYDEQNGLGLDLDFLIPFAAVNENGRDITSIDALSELSHRVMLTNLLRMIGLVKAKKQERRQDTNPTNVILPLSPNHGTFGSDGLYSESKLGLEIVFNKWKSENWQDYISITGAVIGWTRGTGLMEANNLVSHGIESLGVRTFNQAEMAYAILGLLSQEIVNVSHNAPVVADLTGAMRLLPNLKSTVDKIRSELFEKADIQKAINLERITEMSLYEAKPQPIAPAPTGDNKFERRSNFKFSFPDLPSQSFLENLKHMRGMVDLEKVVVVVGLGEVGPWGNSRTRWDIESKGQLSIEGCIELAWIMGLIKYHNGPLKEHQHYVGWVDAKNQTPVKDHEVKVIYEPVILQHCGIREIEPELFEGYNPHKKTLLCEVALNDDMTPIEVMSADEAAQFKREHGDKVEVFEQNGRWFVQLKKGSALYIPRAIQFDRFVSGQIPTGWDAARYGIPQDILTQVDRVTLYNLVSTAEALMSAGIVDPYEFYQYVHISQVGNTSGSGVGGLSSIRKTFRERLLEKPIQADILQETFINVMPAWVNMLLLSSSGPIKTPVGACATAAESVEIGVDCILSGKARIVIVGGYDDFGEESSYEFGQMQATSNTNHELEMGRTPAEMSRPTTDTRAGFMESAGAGTQILMSADLALKMGVPIYGIVALTNTATDKVGRSVPAPGRGILTTAKEHKTAEANPLLDFHYRKRQLDMEKEMIQSWKEKELARLQDTGNSNVQSIQFVEKQAQRKLKAALNTWGNEFYAQDDSISPIRGALAVWGLTIDDINIASFHGTGTKANDFNESEVTQLQMEHLGRTKGNALIGIFQKYLTGHPKGAAAAWMLNGLLQSLLSGVVPGNKNADNVDKKLQAFDFIVYPNKAIETSRNLRAGMLKSFGFGQASAEILVVHPSFLYATLDPEEYTRYIALREKRQQQAFVHGHKILTDKKKLINVKHHTPYLPQDEVNVYLDPKARAQYNPKTGSWDFPTSRPKQGSLQVHHATPPVAAPQGRSEGNNNNEKEATATQHKLAATSVEVIMRELAEGLRQPIDKGVGIDLQLMSSLNLDDEDFIKRNFTDSEIAYCKTEDRNLTRARFAGRWAAKEAVVKAISSSVKEDMGAPIWKGSAAALKGIEILPTTLGPPKVVLHGHALELAKALGITGIKVQISHSGEYALSQARIM